MIRRIFTAYIVEYIKYSRLTTTFVGPILVLLLIALAPLGYELQRDGISDYAFVAYALSTALNLFGFLMVLVFSASLFSTELGSGTIRMLLVRPLRRHELLAAKTLIGMTYALVLSGSATVLVWVLTLALGDLTGVEYGGELVYSGTEMYQTFLIALGLSLLPQFAGVAYAIMISTMTRNTATAIGLAVGLWLLLDLLKYPLRIAPYLFSTYLGQTWSVFTDRCNAFDTPFFPAGYYAIGSSLATMTICLSVAAYILSKRNFRP